MPEPNDCSDDALISHIDGLNAQVGSLQRELLRAIAEGDRRQVWEGWGAGDMAHWVSMRCGISYWKASRWVAAAHALEELPMTSDALASGDLSLDKTAELTRFATPSTEAGLVEWAQTVSPGLLRRHGDLAARASRDLAQQVEEDRTLTYWFFDEGRRFALEAELPAADGAAVARTLDRLAASVPVLPGEDQDRMETRRADALVMLASGGSFSDKDPADPGQASVADGATVIVHAQAQALASGDGNAEIVGDGLVHVETARRLACSGRVQVVLENASGEVLGLGRMSRVPAAWMMRQLTYRDRECRFPGCGRRRYVEAHHIVWWENGGRTDLDNLVLICSFHHKLVHEFGWRLRRHRDGTVLWFHPDGTRYRTGPAPPDPGRHEPQELPAVG